GSGSVLHGARSPSGAHRSRVHMSSLDSFGSRSTFNVDGTAYSIFRLDAPGLASLGGARIDRLPISLRILLENLLRNEDGAFVKRDDIAALATWDVKAAREQEIAFRPTRINPLQPADLVIDHSVQVDEYGTEAALLINTTREFERNNERYAFLRWGQRAFRNFSVVPPGTGICHQVNLEYLGRSVFSAEQDGVRHAYPDSLVGTDSHTTMINGLGVVGWGVGGIEAEAAMLGQPLSMLVPEVVGFKLHGRLPAGATATDLVLAVTQMLRKKKVVGKFVEFYGVGLSSLSLADRATIGNMAPEYGATIGFFPVDDETLKYLRFTGRSEHQVQLVEAYAKAQGMFRTDASADPVFSDTIELDLGTVEPSLAAPKRCAENWNG